MKLKVISYKLQVAIITNLILLSLLGCQQQKAKVAKVEEIIPVKVNRVELRGLEQTIDYVGDIKAQDEAIVYPKVTGKIIEKVKIDGEQVNKGEAIAYIDRDEVGLKFEKAPVESPLGGIVGRVYVDRGENVTVQTPVALVVNMDKVKIDLDIPEKYLPQISLGQIAKITVDAYPQQVFIGNVVKVSPVVDADTRTAPIEISVDNPGHRLKSGMFAKVELIIQKRESVPVILKDAIIGKDPNLYIYVIENKKAVSRKIVLGINQGPYYEVKEGLKEGDLVVIMGQQRLYEGAQVQAEEEKE